MTLPNGLRNSVHIEGPLWDQNGIGSAGNAAIESDPSRVAPHDLNHHHSIMCFCGRMNTVNRFAHDVAGGIEAKGIVGAAEIVIDRLRYANHLHSFFVELLRDGKRVVTSDRYQRVELVFLDGRHAAVKTVWALGRISPGGAENGAAAGKYPAYTVEIQFDALVFNQSAPALQKSHELVVVVENSFAHDRANDSVKTRTVAPAG